MNHYLNAVQGRCLQHIIVGNETHFIDSVLPVILRCILVVLPVWSQVQRQIYQIRITDGICGIGYVLFVELVISILKQFVCDALAFCIQYIDIKIHAFGNKVTAESCRMYSFILLSWISYFKVRTL